jgi:hypothetical protein
MRARVGVKLLMTSGNGVGHGHARDNSRLKGVDSNESETYAVDVVATRPANLEKIILNQWLSGHSRRMLLSFQEIPTLNDLLLFKNGRRLGIEIKRADAPTLTPSMRSALADLKLEQLIVLYPGSQAYELEPRVRVLPIGALAGATVDALFPKTRRTRAVPEVR